MLLLLLLVLTFVFFTVFLSNTSLNLILNWFVNLSKSCRTLNQLTSFGVGVKNGPFLSKDWWCWLSSIFVRLITFLLGIFFFISARSYFFWIFLTFLLCLIFYLRFSFGYRRFFFLVSWLFDTHCCLAKISSVLFLVTSFKNFSFRCCHYFFILFIA